MSNDDEILNRIEQVDQLYPMPEYVVWFEKFPSRAYITIAAIFVLIGVVTTALKLDRIYQAIPTFITGTMILFIACLFIPAWYMKRSVEKKRRKYLLQ